MALPLRLPQSRRYRIALTLIFAALLPALGFLILPPVVKSQLEGRLGSAVGRQVTVGKVSANPYALTLTVEGFSIAEADGKSAWMGWRRLHIDFDLISSLRGEWVISEILLDGFHTRVGLKSDGTFNFSDILAKLTPAKAPEPAKAPPSGPGRPIRVVRLEVTDSKAEFSDASRKAPFATTLSGITVSVAELRSAGQTPTKFQMAGSTEAGEVLRAKGTVIPEGLRIAGEASAEGINLLKYAPYYGSS